MKLHLVSHTHWDREWYHVAGRFRQRLAELVDDLLDNPPVDGASFLLDGQTVVLGDALIGRPDRIVDFTMLLRSGAIEVGPWFVLPDELIPSGEALVRNLLTGLRAMRGFRLVAPPVLYCPDSFGHPAALPTIARGFGFEAVILWRGFGSRRFPRTNACWWRAPSGERVLLYHLPRSGYEFGADLPADPTSARVRWNAMKSELAERARLSVGLLPNGADHHMRQRDLSTAIAALARAAAPDEIVPSSLSAFATAALAEAKTVELPEVQGELRDSYGYTWTLQGTFATRAYQKRRAATLERVMVREVEPWTALAARRSSHSRRFLINAAWRELVLCQPHDTICGCSIDAVARAFDARADEAGAQADGLRADAIAELMGHDADAARVVHDAWKPHVVVRNAAARARGGVAIVRVSRFVSHVRVGPGSGAELAPAPVNLGPLGIEGAGAVQVLRRELVHERTESPRGYPDDDLVERANAAIWIEPIAGYGLRAMPLARGRARRNAVPNPVVVNKTSLSNGLLRVDVGADGNITLTNVESGRALTGLLSLEDQDDAGDLYTPSLRGSVRTAECIGVRVVHRGPLRGAIEMRWRVAVRRSQRVTVSVTLALHADSALLRIIVAGDNQASDHRLRLRMAGDVPAAVVYADAAFGPVQRTPLVLDAEESAVEAAPPTAPLHRYVTLTNARRGLTVFSDGLAEYEADANGAIHVTLVRAVGELSRHDLPERPGHAGWPTPTPEAQCHGPFSAELALLLHDARDDAAIALVERTADDFLTPLTGDTIRSLMTSPPAMAGLSLEGDGLAFSAAKESEDGEWLVLRCVNLLERPVQARWVVAGGVREARMSRLDETPAEPLSVADNAVSFDATSREVTTILVR